VVVEYSPPITSKEDVMEVEVRPADESEMGCTAQGPRALCCAAAAVPLFGADMEAPVLGQQQWEAVHDRRREGHSISAIARDLCLDRKTVRRCLLQGAWRPYQRIAASSVLDPHREWLAARAPEVDYSARILWQELRARHGFAGSYVIVRRAVAPLRLAAAAASLTQCRFGTSPGEQAQCRFETSPGEQAQCDWGQVGVALHGRRRAARQGPHTGNRRQPVLRRHAAKQALHLRLDIALCRLHECAGRSEALTQARQVAGYVRVARAARFTDLPCARRLVRFVTYSNIAAGGMLRHGMLKGLRYDFR
jgi:hypothetical protein